MSWNRTPAARIFINYRRDDTRWAAGRLMDSLGAYFGDDRVFRDVEGIEGGAEFGHVIHRTMDSADAVVVLIGPDWLTVTNENGETRLNDPNDWVSREISSALTRDIPIYPVLIDGTLMPRVADLPESLQELAQRNAVSLSEQHWESDVTRLATLLAIDIPGSAAQRSLDRLRMGVSSALFAAILFTTMIFVWNVLGTIPELRNAKTRLPTLFSVLDQPTEKNSVKGTPATETPATLTSTTLTFATLTFATTTSASTTPTMVPSAEQQSELPLLKAWQSGLTYVVIVVTSILLLVYAHLVDISCRHYAYASGLVGLIGTAFFFLLLLPTQPDAAEPVVMFLGSTVVATAMFVTMNLSGFKAK